MITLLPVKIYNKYVNIQFNIDIINDTLIVNPVNNEFNLHYIILYSTLYGISIIPICFPLNFIIFKHDLICDQFYIFQILSSINNIDFVNLLISAVNSEFKKQYRLYTHLNIPNLISILKLNNNNEINLNEIDTNSLINKTYYRINKYLNFCLAIMSDKSVDNVAQSSKISQIINCIKQIKVNFYGNTFTIEEHFEHINNRKLIKRKRYYFYEKNKKIIKIFINTDTNLKDYNDFIVPYPTKYKEYITIKNLINLLIITNYNILFESACKVLYKKKPQLINLLINYIIKDTNIKNNIDSIIFYNNNNSNDYNIKDIINLTFTNYKQIINKIEYNEKILIELINNYSYPINYDKRTLTEHFAKILYFCFHFKNIQYYNITNKIKNILLFLVKFRINLINNSNIIYTSRIYTDNILYQIIKIMIFNDTYNLFNDIPNINKLKQSMIDCIVVIHILNSLTWKNIPKQLTALKHIIYMKDSCKDLILIDDKLNKQYTYYMDPRLKKIIINPLTMFNYLKKEEDFYKWIINFKEHIIKIFNNMITLDNTDYIKLSKILYYYSKIKNQSVEDEYYNKILKILKNNNRLILFNDRINIKFKDIFKNININLGYLARDIISYDTISITISDDNIDTTETISKLKKKYYKYKGKYLEIKYTDTTECTVNS